jgi:hypothetical protein
MLKHDRPTSQLHVRMYVDGCQIMQEAFTDLRGGRACLSFASGSSQSSEHLLALSDPSA